MGTIVEIGRPLPRQVPRIIFGGRVRQVDIARDAVDLFVPIGFLGMDLAGSQVHAGEEQAVNAKEEQQTLANSALVDLSQPRHQIAEEASQQRGGLRRRQSRFARRWGTGHGGRISHWRQMDRSRSARASCSLIRRNCGCILSEAEKAATEGSREAMMQTAITSSSEPNPRPAEPPLPPKGAAPTIRQGCARRPSEPASGFPEAPSAGVKRLVEPHERPKPQGQNWGGLFYRIPIPSPEASEGRGSERSDGNRLASFHERRNVGCRQFRLWVQDRNRRRRFRRARSFRLRWVEPADPACAEQFVQFIQLLAREVGRHSRLRRDGRRHGNSS